MTPDVISFEGELDISRFPEVCEVLSRPPAGKRPVILDMSRLVLVDSLCLSEMLLFRHRMENDGRSVAAIVSDPKLYRVFALANVIELLNVYRSYDDAVAAFAGGQRL